MTTDRSREAAASAFAFVIGASSVIDVANDTPWRTNRWIGPFFQLTPATQLTSATCAALLTLLALFLLVGRLWTSPARTDVWARFLALMPGVSMVYAFVWARVFVRSPFVIPWDAMVVAVPALVCFAAFERWPRRCVAGLVLLVGIVVRLIVFARFPVDEGADMLPLTRAALGNLVKGVSPYTYYNLPDPLPLTYFPFTWLAYLPCFLARADLRWTNLVAELAIVSAIVWTARHARESGDPASGDAADRSLLAWGFVFLLPSSIHFDRITTAPIAWALITWCVALLARRSRHDWILLGATAAATPLAAVLIPFVCVVWWQRHSLRGMLRRGLWAALLTAFVLAPFVLWSPRGFLDGAILWFNDLSRYPGVSWREYQPWERYAGFGGLFWGHGLERALAPVQWLLVMGIAVLFAKTGGRRLAAHVAAAFLAFMLFNSVNWPYFYQPAIFVGLLAIASAPAPEPAPLLRDERV